MSINKPKGPSTIEQVNNLLKLNDDMLYGVFSIDTFDRKNKYIKLCLNDNALVADSNKFKNLRGLDEALDIDILDLKSLRAGEIKMLKGFQKNIPSPILLSSGVIDYVVSSGNKHIITTLRDTNTMDNLQYTTTSGRNSGPDLEIELLREYIEEAPFIGRDGQGNYALATISTNSEHIKILKNSINNFLKYKYTLDRNNPDDLKYIDMFERSFIGIKYEELGKILREIMANDRFMEFYTRPGSIAGFNSDIYTIEVVYDGKTHSGEYYLYIDKVNNTLEYRKILEITHFDSKFNPLSNRPARLYLESRNQYPRLPRLSSAYITSNIVPTIEYFSKKYSKILKND